MYQLIRQMSVELLSEAVKVQPGTVDRLADIGPGEEVKLTGESLLWWPDRQSALSGAPPERTKRRYLPDVLTVVDNELVKPGLLRRIMGVRHPVRLLTLSFTTHPTAQQAGSPRERYMVLALEGGDWDGVAVYPSPVEPV